MSTSFNLEEYRVKGCGVSNVYYIPNFLTEDVESYLIRQIIDAPKPKWKGMPIGYNSGALSGGEITGKSLFAQPLPPFLAKYPDIVSRLRDTGAFSVSKHGEPNHVIVNEYLPGQGIMPHEDGPSYHPVVATISLGSHTVFNYYRYKDAAPSPSTKEGSEGDNKAGNTERMHSVATEPTPSTHSSAQPGDASKARTIDLNPIISLLLEPRSLVITTSNLYTTHLHGIESLTEDLFANHGPLDQLQHNSAHNLEDSSHKSASGESLDDSLSPKRRVSIANWEQLQSEDIKRAVLEGGSFARGTRWSLTCRDVERVVNVRRTPGKSVLR